MIYYIVYRIRSNMPEKKPQKRIAAENAQNWRYRQDSILQK